MSKDENKTAAAPETPVRGPEEPNPMDAWRWPIAMIFLGLFALIGFIITIKTGEEATTAVKDGITQSIDTVADAAVEAAGRFTKGQITHSFTSAIPSMSPGGNQLEVAKLHTTETFTRTDTKTTMWDLVYLGTTTSEIKVPVTYRYLISLNGPWSLDVKGHTCVVIAPDFHPAMPPAIHTDRMEKRSDRGWARLNESEQMEDLQKSITPTLEMYAGDVPHKNMIREQCRMAVAEFVKNWLLEEDQWRTDRFHSIKVIFQNEAEEHAPEQFAPVLEVEN